MTEPTDWAAKRAALPERWTGTGLKPMSAFEMAAAVYRDSLIDMLVVPVSMYDLTAYDRRGLLNLVAALLDREAEATAAAEQRLRTVRAGIEALIEERGGRCVQPGDFEAEGLNICEAHHELMFDGYCEDDPRDLRAVLALLDTPAPASPRQGEPQAALASDPASPSEPAIPLHQGAAAPRQGEPVDGLDVAWRAVEDALPDGWDGPRMLPIGTRGSVSRWVASAIAHSAAARGNRAWIVDGSGPTPAEALQALTAALSEPAEAGEP